MRNTVPTMAQGELGLAETGASSDVGGDRAGLLKQRLARAKKSFAVRRVDLSRAAGLIGEAAPAPGDLVLATVVDVGHHARLESPEGRRAELYAGDEIVVAYGARYAPDQFEAIVPVDLSACHLVAGGGIAAQMVSRHAATRKPTTIAPIGLLSDASGRVLNVSQFAMPPRRERAPPRNVIAFVGTSMNAGKTTAAASLIRGLTRGGVRVGACKVTGTGSGGDLWSMRDAGAVRAFDFTDAGYATTAGVDIAALERAALSLVNELEHDDIDVIVIEIADGLFQRETAALLKSPTFSDRLDAVMLCAADSMGAVAGAQWLHANDLPIRAVTGLVTASPLATREARDHVDVEVVETAALGDAESALRVCLCASSQRKLRSVAS